MDTLEKSAHLLRSILPPDSEEGAVEFTALAYFGKNPAGYKVSMRCKGDNPFVVRGEGASLAGAVDDLYAGTVVAAKAHLAEYEDSAQKSSQAAQRVHKALLDMSLTGGA